MTTTVSDKVKKIKAVLGFGGDLATFNTSGFVAVTNTRTPPQPLNAGSFKYVDRGPLTGQVVLKPAPQKGAVAFHLRYCPVPAAGASPNWVDMPLPGSKAVTVSNLTPGANYQFQIRALGRLGSSDWSDVVTFICA